MSDTHPEDAAFADLSAAQVRQAELLAIVGRLAGGIAHDFNNLLATMIGYAEFLEGSLQARGDCGAELTDLKEIQMSAARMQEQTRRLLAFAQRLPTRPTLVQPQEIVRGLERSLRRLAPSQTDVAVSLTTVSGYIEVDRPQIEQVLVNLAINSFDAMPGGGTLTIGAEWRDTATHGLPAGVVIASETFVAGPCMHFRVTDTGRGMPADYVRKAFQPYETTKTTPGAGKGLGLAAVYGLVAKARGMLVIESALHAGTTAHVLIPEAAAASEADTATFEERAN
ncbi:MAG: hypothetical protein H7Z40_20270 [Phycisphaerae bacterium]|nr:hypothetical protein [Gemmatimonadaceae bacterium]